MANKEDNAWELLRKSHFILNKLPDFLRIRTKQDMRSHLSFHANDSEMLALPSTIDAGRGTDATTVVRDELRDHPCGKENYTAISPAIDAGGQGIDLSTIFKGDISNHFTERVLRAKSGATLEVLPSGLEVYRGGESGATLVFLGWRMRPTRQEGLSLDEWWDLRVVPKLNKLEREQEYPATIEEALSSPSSIKFLDQDALQDMMWQIKAAIKTEEINTRNGIINVFELPVVGEKYCVYTDPSNGDEDPFHTVVLKPRTGVGVCEATGWLRAEECAKVHDELVRYFNNAHNSYEINAQAGGTFGATLNNLSTPNQAVRRKAEGEIIKDKLGQYISPQLKKSIISDLELPIRRRLLVSHHRETIQQMQNLIKFPGEDIPRVPTGMHDDTIMAWAGAWRLQKYMVFGTMKIQSFSYKESG